jgi:hypothetical protein
MVSAALLKRMPLNDSYKLQLFVRNALFTCHKSHSCLLPPPLLIHTWSSLLMNYAMHYHVNLF